MEILREAAEAAGMPPGALQVIPDAAHDVTHHLFHHPKVDFIWVTGGPKIVKLANQAGKPSLSVGPGNAPIYIHKTADVRGAVVDILISKTFDSSVICPAEQTCIIDDEIYDEMIAEFERMGARMLSPEEAAKITEFAFGCGDKVSMDAVGQKAPELAARAGFSVPPGTKILLAPLPSDLDELAEHPLVQEKLMPVLGLVRAPDVQTAIDAAVLVTEHGGLGHTSAIYGDDQSVIDAYALAVRTGRILVNAPTAVGALGGVYNNLTPTFSLGCGTWGGSSTTENVNYRQLLNIKTVSQRRTPPQWFRVPSNTFFNAGALDNLRELDCETVVIVTDNLTDERGVVEMLRGKLPTRHVHAFTEVTPEPDEETIQRGVALLQRVQPDVLIAVGGGSVLDAGKAMRLFYEHPEKTLEELTMPFLDPRKRVADYPTDRHKLQLIAIPTTSGTGSEVSPAAVITMGPRKQTLVDYSLVPEVAIVDPLLTSSMPPSLTADTGVDALTHALEAAVSIFASPYTDAQCAGGPPHLRRAAAGLSRPRRPRGAHPDVQRRDAGRLGVLERVRRHQPRPGARDRRSVRDSARPGQRHLPATCVAVQRQSAEQVHAGAGLLGLHRPGEVRPGRFADLRRSFAGGQPQSAVRRGGPTTRRVAHAALAAGGRGGRGGLPGGAADAGDDGLRRPQQPHQPADAAGHRDRRPAEAGVLRHRGLSRAGRRRCVGDACGARLLSDSVRAPASTVARSRAQGP